MHKPDLLNGSFIDLTTRRRDQGAMNVAAAVDALIVQSFAHDIPTERVKEMIVDFVAASLLVLEKIAINERAEVNLTALLQALPERLTQIRNGRPVARP